MAGSGQGAGDAAGDSDPIPMKSLRVPFKDHMRKSVTSAPSGIPRRDRSIAAPYMAAENDVG